MCKRITIRAAFLLAIALPTGLLQAVGLMPVPTLEHATIEATASFDPDTARYSYDYTVQNPGINTGAIWSINIDIRRTPRFYGQLPSSGLTIAFGSSVVSFVDMLSGRQPLALLPGVSILPIGQQTPPGWSGGFGRDGYARFTAGSQGIRVLPGNIMSGFTMISYGVPTIREVRIVPDWVLLVEDHDAVTEEQLDQAAIVEKNLPFVTYSVGPSGLAIFGSDAHWTLLAADIQRAAQLGWFTDAALAESLNEQLNFARQALDQGDGSLAKARLQPVLQTIMASSAGQRNQEIFDLVSLNLQRLISNTLDTPVPFEPVYTLTPATSTHSIGSEYTVTAKVVNGADNNAPVANQPVLISIVEGPHAPANQYGITDDNGEFTFSYVGTKVGTDHLVWWKKLVGLRPLVPKPIQLAALGGNLAVMLAGFQPYPSALAEAEVIWTGGSDLVIPFFMPPKILSQGGNRVFVTEMTRNIGILAAPESVTRYYLSDTIPMELGAARIIGERRVSSLEPMESSNQNTLQYTLPNDLPEGAYYMAACADADNEVIEQNEDNNCSFNQLSTSISMIIPLLEVTNSPPDCSGAYSNISLLWPPNHKLVEVMIEGVVDLDNDVVSIRIVSIRQDEPVNGLGDGDASLDGFGLGTSTALLRAERAGLLNGRVYEIGFIADDGHGIACTGTVSVGVSHDKGGQPAPVNDGSLYDSTIP